MMTSGKSGEHLAELRTSSLYQMVCWGCPLMTSGGKVGNIKRSRGPPPCIRWCVVDAYDDLGEKWGTLSGAGDPLLVSDGVLWPSYDDLGGKSGEH